ncbi:bZIP transcription factor [Aspergillus melleus]|uniref:bZIP transcription factor n=1 Tax=Aspergillus melleus TaxID=138277 RepID=UPI001E8DA586|nr:uncharacterized protein LDX57_001996 [Aspergillus melleus]KAH8424238.1 hypothetical protein LDX57_001996 [Aspergillus melleus]
MAPKRKAKQLVVPDIAEDAAERKRVLNILAQRRYRQRRKDHLTALESRAKGLSEHLVGSTQETSSTSSSSLVSINAFDNTNQILNHEDAQCSNVQAIGDQSEKCILPHIATSDLFLQFVPTSAPQPETDLSIAPDDSF